MTEDESGFSAEGLAEGEFLRLQRACSGIVGSDGSNIGAAMLVVFNRHGIDTVPYIHHEYDPREASLWLLGGFLAHIDDSTPEDTHPLEIADHALALMDDYKHDPHVGWSTEKGVDGQPWEGDDGEEGSE